MLSHWAFSSGVCWTSSVMPLSSQIKWGTTVSHTISFDQSHLPLLQAKFDVFNALTLMDNNLFLSDLKVSVSRHVISMRFILMSCNSSGRATDI